MRIYELTFIVDGNLDDQAVKAEVAKIEQLIKGLDGTVLEVQEMGLRSFACEIKKQRQGHYVTIYYQADPQVVKQIENTLKLSEPVLRFLTVVLAPKEYKPRVQEERTTA